MAVRGPVVEVERVYDEPGRTSAGRRVLVDRLWPRGVAKAAATWDEWAKDVAPSTQLRRWYGHEVDRFDEFVRRYCDELERPPASDELGRLAALAPDGPLTLVTATRDVDHSAAAVLRDVLLARVA